MKTSQHRPTFNDSTSRANEEVTELIRIVFGTSDIGEYSARIVTGLAQLSLPLKFSELLILQVAMLTECEYEWTCHQLSARACGVSDAQIAAISQGQIRAFVFSKKEQALLRFVSRITASPALINENFQEARRCFSKLQIIEMCSLQSACLAISNLINITNIRANEEPRR
jgi:alkylhydroperoxidase family enzyme